MQRKGERKGLSTLVIEARPLPLFLFPRKHTEKRGEGATKDGNDGMESVSPRKSQRLIILRDRVSLSPSLSLCSRRQSRFSKRKNTKRNGERKGKGREERNWPMKAGPETRGQGREERSPSPIHNTTSQYLLYSVTATVIDLNIERFSAESSIGIKYSL